MDLKSEIRKQHPFTSGEAEVFVSIARTHLLLSTRQARLLKQHGLSEATYNVLRILRGAKRFPVDGQTALQCNDIAGRMITSVPDLTRLLDRLDASGHVTRQRSTEDRRVVRVQITRLGLSLVDKLDAVVEAEHRQTLGHLTKAQQKQLLALLQTIRAPLLDDAS